MSSELRDLRCGGGEAGRARRAAACMILRWVGAGMG